MFKTLCVILLLIIGACPCHSASTSHYTRLLIVKGTELRILTLELHHANYQVVRESTAYNLKKLGLRAGSRITIIAYTHNCAFISANSFVWKVLLGSSPRAIPILASSGKVSVAPSGCRVLYDGTNEIMTQRTERPFRVTLMVAGANDPVWSKDGRFIAYALYPNPNSLQSRVIIRTAGGRSILSLSLFNPTNISLSPHARFLAAESHLSRPTTGDSLYDVIDNGKQLPDLTPSKYLPGVVIDWSHDGSFVLWEWRIPDPKNSGAWLGTVMGATDVYGRHRYIIGCGTEGYFMKSRTRVIWLEKSVNHNSKYLVISDIARNTHQIVAKGISAFAIMQ